MMKQIFYYFVFLASLLPVLGQDSNISALKIKDIMEGEDFIGHSPSGVFWATDQSAIYFDWNPNYGVQ